MEYGNPFDVMGLSSGMGHFNGWFKSKAGWTTVTTVEKSGKYTINALEDDGDSHVLHIPQKGVCFEYRKPIGYDNYPARAGEVSSRSTADIMRSMVIPEPGVLLSYTGGVNEQGRPTSFLIDTRPGTYAGTSQTYQEFSDAMIPENTVFKDDRLGVTVSFVRSTQNRHWAEVEIGIG